MLIKYKYMKRMYEMEGYDKTNIIESAPWIDHILYTDNKYAQNDTVKHQQDFNWLIGQLIQEMGQKGHQDLCYEWILHYSFDEDPKRIMKEHESLSELERIGFVDSRVIWRKKMESIVKAYKGGVA